MIKYTEYKLNSNNNVSFNAGKLPEASALKADRFLKRLSETMSLSQYHDTFNSVTMTKIPGAVKGNLVPYFESRRAVPLSAKHDAYKELLELLKLDIVNIDILNNPEVLKVVNGAQPRIVCEDWSNLCSVNEYLMNFAPDKDYFYLVNKLRDIIYAK